ncbi:MFS transporter [Elusimicrobiota bacterium]
MPGWTCPDKVSTKPGQVQPGTGTSSIIPQLVSKDNIPAAIQSGQAIRTTGQLLGASIGGLLITLFGVSGAFAIDSISFLIAGFASFAIKSNTLPSKMPPVYNAQTKDIAQTKRKARRSGNAIRNWISEMRLGFQIMRKIPIFLWLAIMLAFINFAYTPISITLPFLIKETRNMPPWFLGTLYSCMSLGSILGSLSVGWLRKKMHDDILVVSSISALGMGIALIPLISNQALLLLIMFISGTVFAAGGIPGQTRRAIAVPDMFRSRVESIYSFFRMIAAPLGTAFAGLMVPKAGIEITMLSCGIIILIICPAMYLIPGFLSFYRTPLRELDEFILKNYPRAFK